MGERKAILTLHIFNYDADLFRKIGNLSTKEEVNELAGIYAETIFPISENTSVNLENWKEAEETHYYTLKSMGERRKINEKNRTDTIITVQLAHFDESLFYEWFEKSADSWHDAKNACPHNAVIGLVVETSSDILEENCILLKRHLEKMEQELF